MKKYIGTKLIEAEPMTCDEALSKGLLPASRRDTLENEGKTDGYHVRYNDGYESWSPKDVFEGVYKVAETAIDRMAIEEKELLDRLAKLQDFIKSDKFKELPEIVRAQLVAQASTMDDYQMELNRRGIGMAMGITSFMFNFGIAISLLREGFAVCRRGWNGKGLFVVKQVPAHITEDVIPKMQSLPQSAKDLVMNGTKYIDYTSQCLIINTDTGQADSWTPSISDVFAKDWELFYKE